MPIPAVLPSHEDLRQVVLQINARSHLWIREAVCR
jgi:hypothetical protein